MVKAEQDTISVVDVAAYLMAAHERIYGDSIDEMKLHCLLYFAQRESYAIYDRPLFPESFLGRPDGPFSPEAHEFYHWVQEHKEQVEEESDALKSSD